MLVTNRRAARLFVGPGDALEETDRFVDDVHSEYEKQGWSPSKFDRSVEQEVKDHLANAADLAFDVYKKRGLDRVLIGAPDELVAELKSKLHPVPARADRGPDLRRHRERVARRGLLGRRRR